MAPSNSINIYATGGRGTEKFISQEIEQLISKEKFTRPNEMNKTKMKYEDEKHIYTTMRDGKVFFQHPINDKKDIKELLQMRSPERIFVAIKDYDNSRFGNKRLFLNKLMQELSCADNYRSALRVMELFHRCAICGNVVSGFTSASSNTTNPSITDVTDKSTTSNVNLSDKSTSLDVTDKATTSDITDILSTTSDITNTKSITSNVTDKSIILDVTNLSTTLVNAGTSATIDINDPSTCTTAIAAKRQSYFDNHTSGNFKKAKLDTSSISSIAKVDTNHCHIVSEDLKRNDDISKLCAAINSPSNFQETTSVHEFPNGSMYYDGHNSKLCGKCSKDDYHQLFTFRMSIKCSGKPRKWLNIERLSRDLARRVARVTGWSSSLHRPLIEICVHISDQYVTAGIPLSRVPLSKRAYIGTSGLRAPIAWIMAHLAGIKSHHRVLDPMCGKATILLEAYTTEKHAQYYGSDKDITQLTTAHQNALQTSHGGGINLVMADCLNLPYPSEYFDKVLCDAPFDQKYNIVGDAYVFYRQFLDEIHRVLVTGGCCVLLTSAGLKDYVRNVLAQGSCTQANGQLIPQSRMELSGPVDCKTAPLFNHEHDPYDSRKSANHQIVEASCPCDHMADSTSPMLNGNKATGTANACTETESRQRRQQNFGKEDQELVNLCPQFKMCLDSEHYVKLGETHAYIMVFHKIKCNVK